MDNRLKRLYEAAHAGDVYSLNMLLLEDNMLLGMLSTTTDVNDNPLHIAATLGHADFARAILELKPELAREFNSQHMSPLHLAAAQGHQEVAEALLQVYEAAEELCCLPNKDGYLPVHIAAIKGRLHLVRLLVGKCKNSVIALTCFEETPLHLAVKAKQSEIVEFLTACGDTQPILNSRDANGNSVLHLALAGRQQKVIMHLLAQTDINFNPVNSAGLTPLDLLLVTNHEMRDLYLAEMLREAGGKTAKELRASETYPMEYTSSIDAHETSQEIHYLTPQSEQNLIVVATLVATLTFTAALNPPGGAIQMSFDDNDRKNPAEWLKHWNGTKLWNGTNPVYPVGSPVYLWALKRFFIYDYFALLSSLFVILLCLPGLIPRTNFKKINIYMGMLLPLVMWSSMYFMVVAFQNALSILLYTDSNLKYLTGFFLLLFDMCLYFFGIVGMILWCRYYATLLWGTEVWERSWMNNYLTPQRKRAIRGILAYISMWVITTFVSCGIGVAIYSMISGSKIKYN